MNKTILIAAAVAAAPINLLAIPLKEIPAPTEFTTIQLSDSISMATEDSLKAGLDSQRIKDKIKEVEQQAKGLTPAEIEQQLVSAIFPVTTASMSLKRDAGNDERALKIPVNLAVIGDDSYSLGWLLANKDELIALRASVMLVNCNSITDYNRIKASVPELDLIPLGGYPLSQEFGLSYYPAPLTPTGIYQ